MILFLAMGGVYAFFTWRDWKEETARQTSIDLPVPSAVSTEAREVEQKLEAKIFFPSGETKLLRAEKRVVPARDEPHKLVSILIEELLKGPVEAGYRTIPQGTRLKDVFLDRQGTVFLNFSSELERGHIPGTWSEALTVYSIVNTIAANIDGMNRVYILVDGSEVDTLGGHFAINRMLKPKPEMVENGTL